MWPFLKHEQKGAGDRRRPLDFKTLSDSIGDYSDLAVHDASVKFWVPQPTAEALKEIKRLRAESMNETLLIFLIGHCYGFYFQQVMLTKHPEIYKDPDPSAGIRFSRRNREAEEGIPKRKTVYYVPELGKNIFPIKLWIPQRLKNDLALLAENTGLTLSEYLREIVIARVFGYGMLPMRPEMLTVEESRVADAWSEGGDANWKEASQTEYDDSMVRHVKSIEIPDL